MTVIKVLVFWDQGVNKFRVRLAMSDAQINSLDGYLPALPGDLEASKVQFESSDYRHPAYSQWQYSYSQFEAVRQVVSHRINPKKIITDSEARARSSEQKESVVNSLNEWLNCQDSAWQPLRDELIAVLSHLQKTGKEARLFLDTDHSQLRRLPWQEWDLFKYRFPQAEVAVRLQSSRTRIQPIRQYSQVKVLALIGNSEGINTQFDEEVIQALEKKNAQVTFLKQPTREELSQALRDENGYHLFIFSGHSCSNPDGTIGKIELNNTQDAISIEEFKSSFGIAIKQGLQLAIFNSCDGLGLAHQLAELGLPRSIVMREPIPDEVAVKFLKYFFEEFSNNKSLFHSIHFSRERLIEYGFEKSYPGVSWLPTLCVQEVTLSSNSLIWQDFIKPKALLQAWIKPLGITASLALVTIFASIFYQILVDKPQYLTPQKIENQISQGEKLQIPSNVNPAKKAGILDYNNRDYRGAINNFIRALNENPNDPETLIYLNNAIIQEKVKTNTGKKVEIGVSVPIGSEPNVSQEILRGVAQAQTEINCGLEEVYRAISELQTQFNCSKGFINETFLLVTIADDEYDPKVAEKVAEAFVNNQNILGVIGHYSSDMTLKAGEIYDKHRLVAISPTSTSVSLSNFSRYVFRTVPSDRMAAQQLFEYMRQQLGQDKKVAVAYVSGNAYSESLSNEFEELLYPNYFVQKCDLSSRVFSAADCVEKAKDQGAEVLLLVPATDESLTKAIGIINNTNGDLQLFGGDSVYSFRTLKDAGEEAFNGNLTIAIPWHRSPDSEFSQQAQRFWKGSVNWRTATSYDATKAIIQALIESRGNLSRIQLYQKLSSPNFVAQGAEGEIYFESSNDVKSTNSVLVVVKNNGEDNMFEIIK